jgi:hypothetical protein
MGTEKEDETALESGEKSVMAGGSRDVNIPKFKGRDFKGRGRDKAYKKLRARVGNIIIANPTLTLGQACKLANATPKQIEGVLKDQYFLGRLRDRVPSLRHAAISHTARAMESSDGRTAVLAARAVWDMCNDIDGLASNNGQARDSSVTVNVAVISERLGSTSIGQALVTAPTSNRPTLPSPEIPQANQLLDAAMKQFIQTAQRNSLQGNAPIDWSQHPPADQEEEPE